MEPGDNERYIYKSKDSGIVRVYFWLELRKRWSVTILQVYTTPWLISTYLIPAHKFNEESDKLLNHARYSVEWSDSDIL